MTETQHHLTNSVGLLPTAPQIISKRSLFRRLCCDESVSSSLRDRLWIEPDTLISSGEILKAGDRTTVVRIRDSSNGRSWLLKRYNTKGRLHTALHAVMTTRAERCWTFGRLLSRYGIPTPWPVAFVVDSIGPFRFRSFLMTEFVSAPTLKRVVQEHGVSGIRSRSISIQFAEIWRKLGELRLRHGDTKATNYLVSNENRLWVIDLDGMAHYPLDVTFRPARSREWNRFLRNWEDQPEVVEEFRSAVRAA